jgi:hypothetical protein
MGKFGHRITGVILLVVWCSMVCAGDWGPQHRSVGTNSSDPGEIVFFILYVIAMEFGKKLDKNYICPVYCDTNHKHIYEIKESNIQTVDRIPRPGTSKDREQSETVLRTGPDVHRLCGDDREIRETE